MAFQPSNEDGGLIVNPSEYSLYIGLPKVDPQLIFLGQAGLDELIEVVHKSWEAGQDLEITFNNAPATIIFRKIN